MIVKPKIRGFICTTAHPKGCEENVRLQAEYAKNNFVDGAPKRVLVIGSSGGYGLASRIMATFGSGADTIGVHFDKEPTGTRRTGTSGFYNTRAFDKLAKENGNLSYSINGDAFSKEIKNQVVETIKKMPGGEVDIVIYSLAAPKRIDEVTGKQHNSVIKPIGKAFVGKTLDVNTGEVYETSVEPANEEEIKDTVFVMGGSDWVDWIDILLENNCLAKGAKTLAYSYIGPKQTHPIYADGTIGRAKLDLEVGAKAIDEKMKDIEGKTYISVNKALVTQASSAIPVVPLYITLLYKVMKEKGIHEDCMGQIKRLYEKLFEDSEIELDEKGRIRLDDLEMREDVQEEIKELWNKVATDNILELADVEGYRKDFLQIFGFDVSGIDYEEEVDIS